jgi:hypothetical protein
MFVEEANIRRNRRKISVDWHQLVDVLDWNVTCQEADRCVGFARLGDRIEAAEHLELLRQSHCRKYQAWAVTQTQCVVEVNSLYTRTDSEECEHERVSSALGSEWSTVRETQHSVHVERSVERLSPPLRSVEVSISLLNSPSLPRFRGCPRSEYTHHTHSLVHSHSYTLALTFTLSLLLSITHSQIYTFI